MFTGISEEIGRVIDFKSKALGYEITVECKKVLEDTKLGDSIMTDGVCLTVKEIGENFYKSDIMAESMKITKFDRSLINKKVNLERALRLSDRLDGHMVQGHVDGVGKIKRIIDNVFVIGCENHISSLVVKKGSIAIDGISLTVSKDDFNSFSVSLIPETFKRSNFKYKKIGDKVNIETDIIHRFIQKHMMKKERLDKNFYLENGF